jgi:hypothetical protein
MSRRGLNDDGTIAREGALEQVPAVFGPVVEAARVRIAEALGPRLHSAYLYGSIPPSSPCSSTTWAPGSPPSTPPSTV